MTTPFRLMGLAAACAILASTAARADDKDTKPAPPGHPAAKKSIRTVAKKAAEPAEVGLLDAARSGAANVEAEGLGNGQMNVSVTNLTNRPLKVVLPPGLVASGATGQMMGMGGMGGMGGGMGGMGGGMGGMGGMGGGMGGMGGGMGGMGGGMGGMGGGMGGMGGGMGGMGGGTMPATMGMMTLGRLIMFLVGEMSSWNFSSIMMGGMMGGMGMGGMGGGMGGMGMGGMGGGMGGGMRSVPPTGAPYAVIGPNQTRNLATRLVSLSPPEQDGTVAMPAQGEKLTLGDVAQVNEDPRVTAAVRRLAEQKAPSIPSQLVMWNVSAGLGWDAIAALSKGWADPRDLDLARQFVANLDSASKDDAGRIYIEIAGRGSLVDDLKKAFKDATVLGLKAEPRVPSASSGPSLALSIGVPADAAGKAEVAVKSSDGRGRWVDAFKLSVPVAIAKDGKPDAASLADAVADGVLARVVDAKLVKGKKVKGKDTYSVQVLNRSPLILNGVALAGAGEAKAGEPGLIWGLSVSPGKVLSIGTSAEAIDRLGLKQGVRVLAVDLSGL